nr:copper resistance protein CopZ [Salicibibacter cibarius]
MTNKTLNVQGMSFLEGSFGELNGFEAVKVDLQDKKVNVTFKSDKVDLNLNYSYFQMNA